ncbi:MAG: hypothetical protein K8S97_08935 [Anaerolineae bacterium]|nr:hypothetical protein [Anaerolineae bacterium]
MNPQFGVISPQDVGLPIARTLSDQPFEALGASWVELDRRAHAATTKWLMQQLDDDAGAFFGHFRVPDGYVEPPQTVNLIAPWQLLAAFDRYQDQHLLNIAQRAATWFYKHHVIDHPMAVIAGGVRDGVATGEIWTKFSAEEVITCLGLHQRTGDVVWRDRAAQSGRYLIQARRHNFAPRYVLSKSQWMPRGWDSWGRAVEALVLLWQTFNAQSWLDEAVLWGQHALNIQADDGAFYLIDGEYYNTDLAPDELRALTWLYEITGRDEFLTAAQRFAKWHLQRQMPNGAWPLTIDNDGHVVMPTVGPGDIPNIGMALLGLHRITSDAQLLDAAYRAFRYTLSVQVTPDSPPPYNNVARAQWGFWSWDPPYDHTQSADQSTHHTRGLWFLIDYWHAHLAEST